MNHSLSPLVRWCVASWNPTRFSRISATFVRDKVHSYARCTYSLCFSSVLPYDFLSLRSNDRQPGSVHCIRISATSSHSQHRTHTSLHIYPRWKPSIALRVTKFLKKKSKNTFCKTISDWVQMIKFRNFDLSATPKNVTGLENDPFWYFFGAWKRDTYFSIMT